MLGYGPCQEVNTETSMVEDSDIEDLRAAAGWGEQGVYEATALISLFNYSGRTEAASGLPVGRIPEEARLPEATLGWLPRRRRAPGRIQRVHAIRWKRA